MNELNANPNANAAISIWGANNTNAPPSAITNEHTAISLANSPAYFIDSPIRLPDNDHIPTTSPTNIPNASANANEPATNCGNVVIIIPPIIKHTPDIAINLPNSPALT